MPKVLSSVISKDTKTALSDLSWQIENIALLLNKYLDFLELENGVISGVSEISLVKTISYLPLIKDDEVFNVAIKKVFEINERKNKYKILGKEYEKNFVIGLKNGIETYRRVLGEKIYKQLDQYIDKLNNIQNSVADTNIEFTTSSRLIVGLGGSSVLETSIKLHHIYGVPYIPASAVKGVLRAYKIWKLVDWDSFKYLLAEELIENYQLDKFNQQKEKLTRKIQNGNFDNKFKEIDKNLSDEDLERKKQELIDFVNSISQEKIEKFVQVFGNQQQKGKLIIIDAYPTEFRGFDIDIMNVHYPDYYQNDKPPADWQNPTPITFLAIPENTTFKFFFKNVNAYFQENKKTPLEQLKEDLKEAFENVGIGAKTALGYGILE